MYRPTGTSRRIKVPTWLYQVVHLTGTVRILSDDELAEQIDTLSATSLEDWLLPKKPWTSSKMTAGRLDMLKKAQSWGW